MKRILLYLLFSIFIFSAASAQNYKYAWIVSPTIGTAGAYALLTSIVNDIDIRNDIKFVIVTGNLTARGNNSTLDSVKIILNKLTVPYYIIPGENDLRWSESAGKRFNSLFNDGHFFFTLDSTRFIGLNSSVLWHGEGGHFSPEEIKWLADELNRSNISNDIFLFSNFPFNEKLDNWYKAANLLSSYVTSFLFSAYQKPKTISKTNGVTTIAGLTALEKGKWNYNIIENKTDSISIYTVSNGEFEFWESVSKNKSELNRSTPKQFFDFSGIVDENIPDLKSHILWQKDLNITSLTSLYTTDKKIIATTANGIISCFDTTGEKIWSYDSKEKIVSTPVSVDKFLIVATLQGDLISLDINNGKVIQTIGIGEPLTSQLVTTDLSYNGSPTTGIIVATADGKLYCYDIYSFELIWENDSAHGLIRTKPLVINHRIFFGSQDGFLYSVDARTGALYWKWTNGNDFYTAPTVCQPVTDGQYIYIATPDKNIYKIDMLLGVTKWERDYNAWESINISSDGKYLVIKSISDKIYFAYTKNGRRYKELRMGYGFDLNPSKLLEWKGNFIFGTEKGKVYLIDKDFKWEPLFFAGNARLNLVQHVKDNIFVVSNIDGKIICFELK